MGARGLKTAESALRLRALGEFLWLKVLIYNLAYGPACDLTRDSAESGCDRGVVTMWRWPYSGGHHMTCHVIRRDNPLRVTNIS